MTPHLGQKTILQAKCRHRVVACGRRFGKTTLGMITITEVALAGGTTWWLAPTYMMADQVWRDLKTALPTAHLVTISEGDRRIDFNNSGGSIAIRSTHNPDTLRGVGLDLAVLDEAAYMEPTVWPNVVRPMLLGRGGRSLFLSTPRGYNWFYELFKYGLGDDLEWMSFRFQSDANPAVTLDELRTVRRTTSDRVYREEYLAEFIGDSGQVFRGIHEAATAPMRAEPLPGRVYVAGVDWGRDHDYTAVAVIDAGTGAMVLLDRFRGTSWSLIRERLRAVDARWGLAVVWAEANSIGAVNIESLQEAGVPVRAFHTTGRSKGPLIEGLALAIESRGIALLPEPILLRELAAYGLERLPGGGYRYSAPAGGHDDTVIATALAWHGLKQSGIRVSFA